MKCSDQLLDVPLLSAKELEAWPSDVRGMQTGEIKTIAGTFYWERATTEMARRQAKTQIRAANALGPLDRNLHFTGLLVAFTAVQLWTRCL